MTDPIYNLTGERLWAEVSACFDTDDGSLPGIEISNLSASGVAAIYAMLRRRSRLEGSPPSFWDSTREQSILVDSVADAAALVASGAAEPFHHCINGIMAGGIELPILGVFVWQNAIELDYRMGPHWGPTQVLGFFELLRECCALDLAAVVAPAKGEGPPYPERFSGAWSSYCSANG